MSSNPLPEYMEQGSKGELVDRVLDRLKLLGFDPDNQIVLDGELGAMGTAALVRLQEQNGLVADGGCGPKTRQLLEDEYNFVIEEVAAQTKNPTDFVQLDGSIITWSPQASGVLA